jgi:DNA-binding NtrC family response regulator
MSLEGRLIVLVEDDPIMGESLCHRLTLEGARVEWGQNCLAAAQFLEARSPDLVVCDIRLPDGTGEDVFRAASTYPDSPPFLFVTGYGDIDQAVRLMRNGAGDYLTKPFEMGGFLRRVEQLLRPVTEAGDPVLGASAEMLALEKLLKRIARVASPVLLQGETGAGKEVCARYLHTLRRPPGPPFVAVNCAAIPKDLLESELFGHERGAFTGATARHVGYAERARDGTLFLDEIAELDLKLQAKLLRLIEDRSFQRVGGETPIPFKARLVCATNADLQERVLSGAFREDLFYRVNVLTVIVPPLRTRPNDIELLARRFVDSFAKEMGIEPPGLSGLAMEELLSHEWPGNVRELRNRIERAVALVPGPWILPGDLFPDRQRRPEKQDVQTGSLEAVRVDAERREIIRALRDNGRGVVAAARSLGISRTTMWEKMRRHGIDVSSC